MVLIRRREDYVVFLFPTLLILAIVLFYPLLVGFKTSFQSYILSMPPSKFNGFTNFVSILKDDRFWGALSNTFVFSIGAVSVEFVLGLTAALLLRMLPFGNRILMGTIMLPQYVTPVVAGLLMRWMFMDTWGMVMFCSYRIERN